MDLCRAALLAWSSWESTRKPCWNGIDSHPTFHGLLLSLPCSSVVPHGTERPRFPFGWASPYSPSPWHLVLDRCLWVPPRLPTTSCSPLRRCARSTAPPVNIQSTHHLVLACVHKCEQNPWWTDPLLLQQLLFGERIVGWRSSPEWGTTNPLIAPPNTAECIDASCQRCRPP
jgi:hypothetical protein